jgi:preprotein translocase subunit SecG
VLTYFIYTLFVISCLILILVVLLQPGKGDVASALGGGTTGAAFGPRGATSLLAKITIGAAICFMGLAFLFSIPGVVTSRSVTSGVEVPADADEPVPVEIPAEGTTAPEGAGAPPSGAVPAGQIEIKRDTPPATNAATPEGNTNAGAQAPEAPAQEAPRQ